MIRILTSLCFVAALSACGVDGKPSPPVEPRVNAGVSITSSGIRPSANIGLGAGPVSVNVGLGRWARGWW